MLYGNLSSKERRTLIVLFNLFMDGNNTEHLLDKEINIRWIIVFIITLLLTRYTMLIYRKCMILVL